MDRGGPSEEWVCTTFKERRRRGLPCEPFLAPSQEVTTCEPFLGPSQEVSTFAPWRFATRCSKPRLGWKGEEGGMYRGGNKKEKLQGALERAERVGFMGTNLDGGRVIFTPPLQTALQTPIDHLTDSYLFPP